MGKYPDDIINLVPYKIVCVYQVGQLTETGAGAQVAFNCDGRKRAREKYKGAITQIIFLRFNDVDYKGLCDYLNYETHKNIALELYKVFLVSETTMHMN